MFSAELCIYLYRVKQLSPLSSTGELRVKSALDRETQASYTLRLEARDGAASPRSSTTSVILTVTDVNDNAPVFDMGRYDFEVYEDKATDELVGTILATDKDQGQNGNVVYDIQNNRDAQTFSLDVNSGKLKLAKGVDRETQASYAFTVTARDRGNPSRSSTVNVKVTIKDVNDNAPTFSKAQYDCSVSENLASDIAVCFVTATDRDVGANGQLSYSISNGNDGSAFRMDVVSVLTEDWKMAVPEFVRCPRYVKLLIRFLPKNDTGLCAS